MLNKLYRLFKFKISTLSYLILFLVALYVLLVRTALFFLPDYKAAIEDYLTSSLNQSIEISSIESQWKGLDPIVDVNGLTVNGVENAYIGRLRIQLSFLNSLLTLTPTFKLITVEHAELLLNQNKDGKWSFAKYAFEPDLANGEDASTLSQAHLNLIQSALSSTTIELNDLSFTINSNKGRTRSFRSPQVSLNYRNDKLFASGQLLEKEGDNVLLNFSLEGNGVLSEQPIWGSVYIEARSSEFFGQILKVYDWEKLSIDNVEASTRIWASFDGLSLSTIQGDLQLSKLDWRAGKESLAPVQNLALSFLWQPLETEPRLLVNDLGFSWAGLQCRPANLILQKQALQTLVQLDSLDIECLSRLANAAGLLSGDLQKRIAVSEPKGYLNRVQISLPTGELEPDSAEPSFKFEAELEQVSLKAFEDTPSGSGIDGYVFADVEGGYVNFDSQNFELGFPELFLEPWSMKQTEGSVSWKLEGENVDIYSQGLRLWQADNSLVYGDFILRLNPDDEEDYLALAIAIQDIDFRNATNFVPSHAVGEGLHRWLDGALISGRVQEGVYYGYGSTEGDDSENSFTSSIRLKAHNGQLKFSDDWPHLEKLEAEINLQNAQLLVEAETAIIEDTNLLNLKAEMPDEIGAILSVTADVETDHRALEYWLTGSPISEHTRQIAEQIDVKGEIGVHIELGVPVSGEPDDEVTYDITSELKELAVFHKASALLFERTQGQLLVSSESGVTAEDISTFVLGYDALLSIATEAFEVDLVATASDENTDESSEVDVTKVDRNSGGMDAAVVDSAEVVRETRYNTVFNLNGTSDAENIFTFFGSDRTAALSGSFDFSADLVIPGQEGHFPRVDIRSNLKGLSREWPLPLSKLASEEEKLHIGLFLKPDQTYLTANLETHNSHHIASEMLFVDGRFSFGEILMGEAEVLQPNIRGLNIAANVETLALMPWVNFIENITNGHVSYCPVPEEDETTVLKQVQLDVNELTAFGYTLKGTSALIQKADSRWQVDINGEDVKGAVKLPDDTEELDVNLGHLVLNTLPEIKNSLPEGVVTDGNSSGELALDPRDFPAMQFSSNKIVLEGKHYGAWRASTDPKPDGLIFRDISGTVKGLNIKGQLNWQYFGEGQHNSILTLDAEGDHIEDLLATFNITPLVTSEHYRSTLALVWPDNPINFGLEQLSGSLSLGMEEGFLKTEDEKTGALRLFGILNADAILRRLKLDFTDLYKSGIGYDDISMKSSMDQGLFTITEPIKINGPAGDYVINGKIDLAEETLDLDMLVELPFSQTVPLAALVLGAPQIGGLVWVADKLLGEPLSALTTSRYDISGTWELPVVELHQAMNASKKGRSNDQGIRDATE